MYRPAILLANKRSYLAAKPSLVTSHQDVSNSARRVSFSETAQIAVVPRDVAFDLGIKRLLCDDNKDNESFWGRDGILVNKTTSTDMDFTRDEHD